VGQNIDMVGYGETGDGINGKIGFSNGTKRGGENVIDRQGSVLDSWYGGTHSDNLILTDFDGPAVNDANTWGSGTPRAREANVAPGDSGGPAFVAGKVAGVSTIYAGEVYGDWSAWAAVSPHNDWINSTMGGVNWNNRTTIGYTPFNTASAWGDGRVPDSGDSVQFSLPIVPPIGLENPYPYISFTQNTTVGTMTVEFGPHTFTGGANTLTTNGAINVDDNGTFVLNGGTVRALPITGMRVGRHTSGRFVQNGGTLDVDQNMYVGTNAASDGEYELNSGNLQVQGTLSIGYAGTGEFIQNGGEVDAVTVIVGELAGSTGTYELNTNDADIHSLAVGKAGTGRFEQHGGDVYVSNDHIRIGSDSSGNGTYEIDDGRLRTAANKSIYVGLEGIGVFNQEGGTVEADTVVLGWFLNGQYALSDGSLATNRYLYVGNYGEGYFSQDGGTLNVGSALSIAVFPGSEGRYVARGGSATIAGGILVGRSVGGTGVSTGILEVTSNAAANTSGSISAARLQLGTESGASGTVIQDAGRVGISGNVDLTLASNTTANYYLRGGELSVGGAINFGPGTENFEFTGGTLHVGTYNGNLVNGGGKLSPGPDGAPGITTINGSYTVQSANAALEIEIGELAVPTGFDKVEVTGAATLGGNLLVSLIDGYNPGLFNFPVLTAASITGKFLNAAPGAYMNTADGLGSFRVHYGAGSMFNPRQVWLSGFAPPLLEGDYNNDNVVDAADYIVWRSTLGTSALLPNDAVGGVIGAGHFAQWKSHFGNLRSSGFAAGSAVPEPSGLVLTVLGGCLGVACRRRR
jgi:hypothetical protein